MAQSNDYAREMSRRIRDDLRHLGLVGSGAEASLRDGVKASVGDLIVTRKNDHQLGVANGNAWRVETIDGETIIMRRMLDADRETGERRFADDTVTDRATGDSGPTWLTRRARTTSRKARPARRPRLRGHRPHRPGPHGLAGQRAVHRQREPQLGIPAR